MDKLWDPDDRRDRVFTVFDVHVDKQQYLDELVVLHPPQQILLQACCWKCCFIIFYLDMKCIKILLGLFSLVACSSSFNSLLLIFWYCIRIIFHNTRDDFKYWLKNMTIFRCFTVSLKCFMNVYSIVLSIPPFLIVFWM